MPGPSRQQGSFNQVVCGPGAGACAAAHGACLSALVPRRLLITLLELSLTMFLGAHWMGCVYFYIGFDPDGSTPPQ